MNKRLAREHEIKSEIRSRYNRPGRAPLAGIVVAHREMYAGNWTARPDLELTNSDDKRAFIAAVHEVRRILDLDVD